MDSSTQLAAPGPPHNLAQKITGNLAKDLASRLVPVSDILQRYQLSELELRTLLEYGPFQTMLREAQAEWESSASTPERIRAKSLLALEQTIEDICEIAMNKKAAAANRLDAAKLLHDITGLRKASEVPGQGAPIERFQLVLNIGDRPVTVDAGAAAKVIDGK